MVAQACLFQSHWSFCKCCRSKVGTAQAMFLQRASGNFVFEALYMHETPSSSINLAWVRHLMEIHVLFEGLFTGDKQAPSQSFFTTFCTVCFPILCSLATNFPNKFLCGLVTGSRRCHVRTARAGCSAHGLGAAGCLKEQAE